MARKQNSSGFDTRSFNGVEMTTDLGASIEAWKERFVSTVGMAKYRRAFGWAVDETAKAATLGIRAKFDKHLRRQSPWTKSAVAYKRLSKSDLNGLENGTRDAEDVYAQVFVKAKQSTYLKYLFGMGNNVRTPCDVGLAQDHILLPWWDNITLTQGVRPTAGGGVPVSLLARLHREMEAGKGTKVKASSRWGVYYGPVTVHGQSHMAYIARPPRVPVTEHDVLHRGAKALDAVIVRRNGDVARVGRRMRDADHPRILFLAVDRATYQPKLHPGRGPAPVPRPARRPDPARIVGGAPGAGGRRHDGRRAGGGSPVTPADQSYLLTLAGLLHAGILADPVPGYDRPAWPASQAASMRADLPTRPFHEEDWESKLRPKPTAARVIATLARGGDDAVAERRGGRRASELIHAAARRPRFGASPSPRG